MKKDPAKFRQILIDKLENGEWPFSVPMGFKKGSYRVIERTFNDKLLGSRIKPVMVRDMIIDPDRSGFIAKVFELYATGQYSLEALRRELKTEYTFPISCTYLHVLVNNRIYIGEMWFEGKMYECNYPKLVSPEIFEKCQQVLKDKSAKGKSRFAKKIKDYVYSYKCLIYCSLCPTARLSCERHKGVNYYKCAIKKRRYTDSVDLHTKGYIREDFITTNLTIAMKDVQVREQFVLGCSLSMQYNLRFFLDNYMNWFLTNESARKGIANLLFKEISYANSIFKFVKRSPFDGQDYQEFMTVDLNNLIIELGYKPMIEEITEKFEVQPIRVPQPDDFELSGLNKKILRLCVNPISNDKLIEHLQISFVELQDCLFELQINGQIAQDDLGYWKVR